MTEEIAVTPEGKPAAFAQIWADSFSQVLGRIIGSALPCAARTEAPAEFPPVGENDRWALVTSSGALRGEMSWRMPPATVLGLAQTFMSEPLAPEAPLMPDHAEAVVELLRQISGMVSTTAKARWGEIQLRIEMAATAPSWPPAETFWLQAGGEGAISVLLEFGLSAALVAELRTEKSEAPKTVGDASTACPAPNSGQSAGALDRLMDVQLAVRMRFGARRLLLREVLDLSPGAVVELDRRVQEPVDLLLDGKLVARGEVVVIDGNYGLRVTDVSPLTPQLGRQDG